MAEHIRYLIIGNGIAGTTAAEILRAEDPNASIGVIADDPFPVYYRPALKDYLGGRVHEDKLWARSPRFYQDHTIMLLTDRVVAIQPQQHAVLLQSGKQIIYQHLLLASGAQAAQLRCPGSNLPDVSTLRTLADYQGVLARLNTVRRVVVVGSGTLALETAETLRQRGLQVTHLLRHRTLWSEVLDATASDLVLQQEQRAGVEVHLEDEIVEITGSADGVNGVLTKQGRRIACQMVLVAIGIVPNSSFIQQSNIACWRGVRVDSQMRTNTRDIYAAGDVVETTNPITGRPRVIGQWYPAIQQARVAAYSMLQQLDDEQPFNAHTFYNATFLYGLDFASVGMTTLPATASAGYQEIVAAPAPRTYRKVILKDGVPVGMLSLGDRKQAMAFKRAIDHRVNVLPVASRLFAADFSLHEWLDQQGVPSPLLQARRVGATKRPAPVVSAQPTAALPRLAASAQTKQGPEGREAAVTTNKRPENAEEIEVSMGKSQPLSGPTEALLVHITDPNLRLRLAETRLSQTNVITIGRQAGVNLLIDEATVSRYHAEIRYNNGTYLLRDLSSSNGTFLNAVRIDPGRVYPLNANDEIRFGNSVRFRFLIRSLTVGERERLFEEDMPFIPTDLPKAPPTTNLRQEPPTQRQPARPQAESKPSASASIPPAITVILKNGPALLVLTEDKERNSSPQVYLLNKERHTTIGREEGSDIHLTDILVSRRHAEVIPGPAGFYIHDLGSSNGVSVNQARIENPYLLSHGDRIKIGGITLFYLDLQAGREKTERLPRVPKRAEPKAAAIQSATVEKPAILETGGQKLEVVMCPRCGVVNMRVARFCASCSNPLF